MTPTPCQTTIAMRLACASLSSIADPQLHPIARDRRRGAEGGSATRRFVGYAHALAQRFLEIRATRLKKLAEIGVAPGAVPWATVDQHALEFLVAQVQAIADPREHPIAKERFIGRRGAADRLVTAAYELAESFLTNDGSHAGAGDPTGPNACTSGQVPSQPESWGVLGGLAALAPLHAGPDRPSRSSQPPGSGKALRA